jgi:hypothetical protein
MSHMRKYYTCATMLCIKIIHSLRLKVKNKPCDGDLEHAFILGTMDCMVVNIWNYRHFALWTTHFMEKLAQWTIFPLKVLLP